jgi:hypothetical protein
VFSASARKIGFDFGKHDAQILKTYSVLCASQRTHGAVVGNRFAASGEQFAVIDHAALAATACNLLKVPYKVQL